jgi:uncharacterized protein
MHIDLSHFTPGASLTGGVIIGAASVILILFNGRIAGISGIVGGLLTSPTRHSGWRWCFIAGLCCSPILASLNGYAVPLNLDAGWGKLTLSGFLVGIGTRYAGGCTSGHGVCGLSRGSVRSLVATIVFMAAAFVSAFIMRHLLRG